MVDDLSCLFPRSIFPLLFWLGRRGNWLVPKVTVILSELDVLLPGSIYDIKMDLLNTGSPAPERAFLQKIIDKAEKGRGTHLLLGHLEAGATLVANGPKLFSPSFEQFESLTNVDLHIPIADFRSPYPALVIRIPNEWRVQKAQELGIDVQRQPRHVLVRTSATDEGKVHIFSALHYPEVDHFNVVTDQPAHADLQSAFSYVADFAYKQQTKLNELIPPGQDTEASKKERVWFQLKTAEYQYCTDAVHAALNCCLMMVNFGWKEGGPLNRRLYDKHRRDGSNDRHGDFKSVDMIQNIVIRKSEPLGERPVGAVADHAGEGERLWEVRPHWRRGHWRRKPGWEAYVERNEKPPLSFVRPTLVRKDRVVGDLGDSQATYKVR